MRYIWRQQLHKTYTTCACLHSKKKKERKKKLKTGKLEKKNEHTLKTCCWDIHARGGHLLITESTNKKLTHMIRTHFMHMLAGR